MLKPLPTRQTHLRRHTEKQSKLKSIMRTQKMKSRFLYNFVGLRNQYFGFIPLGKVLHISVQNNQNLCKEVFSVFFRMMLVYNIVLRNNSSYKTTNLVFIWTDHLFFLPFFVWVIKKSWLPVKNCFKFRAKQGLKLKKHLGVYTTF